MLLQNGPWVGDRTLRLKKDYEKWWLSAFNHEQREIFQKKAKTKNHEIYEIHEKLQENLLEKRWGNDPS